MSSYNLEPPHTAEVRLYTTAGTIDLELFGKQTPLTTRNFLQLCLNGYYDGTIFHRIIPGFVLQGGDPTGTGEGGEAIYDGGIFEDEFHSRLRFNRRGLLGMANTGPNDNGSQFFITLDKAEQLTGKNTMFGRVVGDSIYTITKLAESELIEGSERPLYPVKVTKTEILLNPYSDMVVNRIETKAAVSQIEPVKKKVKTKRTKTLLSFEDGDEGEVDGPMLKKPKFNPKLVKLEAKPSSTESIGKILKSSEQIKRSIRRRSSVSPLVNPVAKQKHNPESQLPIRDEEVASHDSLSSPETENIKSASSVLERTNAQIAELKASMKRNSHAPVPERIAKKSALEQMIPVNVIRGRKRKQGGHGQNDTKALQMLDAFKAKLEEAGASSADISSTKTISKETKPSTAQDDEEGDEEALLCDLHFIVNCQSCQSWDKEAADEDGDDGNDKDWLTHVLSFEKDRLGKDLAWKRKNEEELVVIDPREKAKDIKEEQKAKRLSQKGGSRAWDRDRDKGRVPGVKG